jgi:hypothetical protein
VVEVVKEGLDVGSFVGATREGFKVGEVVIVGTSV